MYLSKKPTKTVGFFYVPKHSFLYHLLLRCTLVQQEEQAATQRDFFYSSYVTLQTSLLRILNRFTISSKHRTPKIGKQQKIRCKAMPRTKDPAILNNGIIVV